MKPRASFAFLTSAAFILFGCVAPEHLVYQYTIKSCPKIDLILPDEASAIGLQVRSVSSGAQPCKGFKIFEFSGQGREIVKHVDRFHPIYAAISNGEACKLVIAFSWKNIDCAPQRSHERCREITHEFADKFAQTLLYNSGLSIALPASEMDVIGPEKAYANWCNK